MRDRSIVIAALNIVLPEPHSADRYASFWQQAVRGRAGIKLRGDTGGLIRHARAAEGSVIDGIYGELLKFTNIDSSGKWLDLSTGDSLTAEDVEGHVRIPDRLKPNLHAVPYIFYPKLHRLIFLSRLDAKNNLTPGMAKKLVAGTLARKALVEKFGEAVVTVEPDRETLKRIFSLPKLMSITIEVTPPNALADVERKLKHFMDSRNATSYVQRLESRTPDGLALEQEDRYAAEVAQANGRVSARGQTEHGRTVELTTQDHPYEEQVLYDPRITDGQAVFEEMAPGIAQRLVTLR